MAEKKTTSKKDSAKKASRQAKPKSVDMLTQSNPGDDTGLEPTEKMTMMDTPVGEVTDLEEPMVDYQEDRTVDVATNVEPDVNETETVDDHGEDACPQEANQELETPEPTFTGDKGMVNDIANILNGIDGVRASRLDGDEPAEEESDTRSPSGKNTTNTEEKNYYSDRFSKCWGGVMYDY